MPPLQDLMAYFAAFTALTQQQHQQLPALAAPFANPFFSALAGAANQQNGEESNTVKISQNHSPQAVAEDVGSALQYGDAVVYCCGVNAINQAIKGLAVMRSYLRRENAEDACVWPHYRDQERNSLSLVVQRCSRGREGTGWVELKVAATSEIEKVAGALSHHVRQGLKVSLVTMGPLAASSAVAAVIVARAHLKNDGLDISFRPQFLTVPVEEDETTRSALQLRIYSQSL
jgi:stage V sporulation protein SpoVS